MPWKDHWVGHQKTWVLVMPYCKLFVEPLDTFVAFPFMGSLLTHLPEKIKGHQVVIGSFPHKRGITELHSTRSHIEGWMVMDGSIASSIQKETTMQEWTEELYSEIAGTLVISVTVSVIIQLLSWLDIGSKIVKYKKELICISKTLRKWSFMYFLALTLSSP